MSTITVIPKLRKIKNDAGDATETDFWLTLTNNNFTPPAPRSPAAQFLVTSYTAVTGSSPTTYTPNLIAFNPVGLPTGIYQWYSQTGWVQYIPLNGTEAVITAVTCRNNGDGIIYWCDGNNNSWWMNPNFTGGNAVQLQMAQNSGAFVAMGEGNSLWAVDTAGILYKLDGQQWVVVNSNIGNAKAMCGIRISPLGQSPLNFIVCVAIGNAVHTLDIDSGTLSDEPLFTSPAEVVSMSGGCFFNNFGTSVSSSYYLSTTYLYVLDSAGNLNCVFLNTNVSPPTAFSSASVQLPATHLPLTQIVFYCEPVSGGLIYAVGKSGSIYANYVIDPVTGNRIYCPSVASNESGVTILPNAYFTFSQIQTGGTTPSPISTLAISPVDPDSASDTTCGLYFQPSQGDDPEYSMEGIIPPSTTPVAMDNPNPQLGDNGVFLHLTNSSKSGGFVITTISIDPDKYH